MGETNGDGKRSFGFSLDESKLEIACLAVYRAAVTEQGIFRGGVRQYLPQWNIPRELEKNPPEKMPADPLAAARYLWTSVFFERINQSDEIAMNSKIVWHDHHRRWFFDPLRVVLAPVGEIEKVMKRGFKFNLQGLNEETPSERYQFNARKLLAEYDGDPRNMIAYNTVAQARANLMEFKGIGTGIANLFIIYTIDRGIAVPRDPKNALLKIDIHKGRFPISCGAVTPEDSEIYRDDVYVRVLEKAYWNICEKNGLDPTILDAALWALGSKGCNRRDYTVCQMGCAIAESCLGVVPEDRSTGRYVILDPSGRRHDLRKGKGQGIFKLG